MTRARNRITKDDCRLTGEVDGFGLIGVRYADDERTFFISPGRLEPCPAENRVRSVVERDLRRTIEVMVNAASQHRVTRQSASPVSRSRPSGRVPTFAKEKRA